ncbi:MAG: alpha/beta fold hydrolase [Actinomycetia bacterium]|nr:alpha/beta fold hydrolase [Actinomycetes bacterium]MCP4225506.1 alpha/beta fold hydrolase [Actinomycetes bacterium]MCP5030228.1 alpha/beta fold hydrolase [Actinomycetes bacterium]
MTDHSSEIGLDPSPVALEYTVTGEGAPVVFTHGWLNTGEVWSSAVEHLDGRVRALQWDLRGHGRSEAAEPGNYGRSFALADLSRMIEVAGQPAILVGHSLGGYLSLAQAILDPAAVAGLVLVAAGPGFRSMRSLEQWNDSVRSMAANADIPPGMEEISMHVDAMVMDRLGEIAVPVMTIVGERDKRFLSSADVFDKHLDVRKRTIVADAGHMVHAKRGEVVANAVIDLEAIVSA